MKSLILVGAGGFGLEVAAYAQDITASGRESFSVLGFLDDTKQAGALHGGLPVLGPTDSPVDPSAHYVIAVGSPQGRRALTEKLTAKGAQFVTIQHPLAYVAATAKLGEGCIIAPFSFVGPEADVGAHTLLNIHATIGHEARTGAYCAFSPYANLHGGAQLGEEIFLGGQAFVTSGIKIGSRSKISAGAVVYSDIPDDVVALGNPASFRVKS